MTNEKDAKRLNLIDFIKFLWYFIINEGKREIGGEKYVK